MLTPQVIAAVKRSFSRSKFAKDFKNRHVVKGEYGKRGGKIVKCNVCGAHIPMYKGQIDHVEPITPIMIPAKYMAFIWLFNRTFCDESNLQIIDSNCHDIKSKKENKERIKWRKRKKYLICRSVYGSKIKVIPIVNMKEFDDRWEIMDVTVNRKQADIIAKKLRKV